MVRRAALSLTLSSFLLLPSLAAAAVASLARDLNRQESSSPAYPYLADLQTLGARVVFTSAGTLPSAAIWATDGTPQGTVVLADKPTDFSTGFLARTSTHIFWVSQGALWASDGSRAGTALLTHPERDFVLPAGDHPRAVVAGDLLIFAAGTLEGRAKVWASDGTPQGTRPVSDILPGSQGISASPFTELGGEAFFFVERAFNPAAYELWRSDGSEAGTGLVWELGEGEVPAGRLQRSDSHLYWITGGARQALWKSDGTPTGTAPLWEIPGNEFPGDLSAVGEAVYFVVESRGLSQLWRSGGTAGSTRMLVELPGGLRLPYQRWSPVAAGDRLFFLVERDFLYRELWVAGATPGSVRPVRDLCAPGCGPLAMVFHHSQQDPLLAAAGDRLFFIADDGAHGPELWQSDGTSAGTYLVEDLCPGPCGDGWKPRILEGEVFLFALSAAGYDIYRGDGSSAGLARLTHVGAPGPWAFQPGVAWLGGQLLFVGLGADGAPGLWRSDGASTRARPLYSFPPMPSSSDPRGLAGAGNRGVFLACDGQKLDYWGSDGTPEGTLALGRLPFSLCDYSPGPGALAALGLAFFEAPTLADGWQLWASDGTLAGSRQLTSSAAGSPFLFQAVELGGKLFFSVSTSDGPALWSTDGTPEGTSEAVDLVQAGVEGLGSDRGKANGRLYFLDGLDGSHRLWVSDGTQAGTRQVYGFGPEIRFYSAPGPSFTGAAGKVFFWTSGDQSAPRNQLWVTDGTAAGTRRIAAIREDTYPSGMGPLVELGGSVYFLVESGSPQSVLELWRSDGTPAGTGAVRSWPFSLRVAPARTLKLTVHRGRLTFPAYTPEAGWELWSSDGTAAGTFLVQDIEPGPESSLQPVVVSPVRHGNSLFFAATTTSHGTELWRTDGTAAGTFLVHDIAPGPVSSTPQELTLAGSRLFFSADDGLTGRELWSLSLDPADPLCEPGPTALCLQGGRFRAEMAWKDFQGRRGVGQAVPLTADTGYFWFFQPSNVETVVKLLNGQGVNGHFWTFYGALSTVEYSLTVTDTQSGATRRYYNPPRTQASVGDTSSFGPLGASTRSYTEYRPPPGDGPPPPAMAGRTAPGGVCTPSPTALCLNGGRFRAELSWRDFRGNTGSGQAVPLTGDTGYFWFFREDNVETVLKVLDGRGTNGHFWVFFGALSNVEYTLTVTDVETGQVKTYFNPLRRFASVSDTAAF